MTDGDLAYSLPGDFGTLVIEPDVLALFAAHKQSKWLSREAGGQLFATFNDAKVTRIVEATGPRASDKRSLFGYRPNRLAEKLEIADRYAKGFHFIGDWHTHYQKLPEPSPIDEQSMRDLVRLSKHSLAGFVLIVVGQVTFPEGLHVSFHSPTTTVRLKRAECIHLDVSEFAESIRGS